MTRPRSALPHPTLAVVGMCFAMACAPPDPVDPVVLDTGVDDTAVEPVEPSVRILFPIPDPDDPEGRVRIEITEDCQIDQVVVVDVDNFELVPPVSEDNAPDKGHLHVSFNGDYDTAATEAHRYLREGVDDTSPLVPQGSGSIEVTLQNVDHTDINGLANGSDLLEYYVADPFGCLKSGT